MKQAFWLLG